MGSSKARSSKKSAPKGKKKMRARNKTPPSSPDSNASDAPGEPRSRRSLRLGNAVVVDFKALSSRGRDYLAQSFSEVRSPGGPSEFTVKQTFASYDELMRFTKQYEKDHYVRLNASMITPDGQRPMGMRDWDYYRFVTLWCNFDPHMRVPNCGYTPIGQRYCPFYVRVAGDVKRCCMAVQAVKAHEHSLEPSGPLLPAPPLPAQLDGQNLPEDPASVAGSRRGRNERSSKAPRRKLGRVVKPRKSVRQRKRAPLAALELQIPQEDGKQEATPPKSPKKSQRAKKVPLEPQIPQEDGKQEAAPPKSPKKSHHAKKGPPELSGPRENAGQEAAPLGSPKKSPRAKRGLEEKPKCALCDFLCQSTEELVGHTWLRHQILTETWDLQ